ncbi:hypothetical protein D3C81_784620 [compost metagenome]
MNTLNTQHVLQAGQMPTTQQADKQGHIEACGEPLTILHQCCQVFLNLSTTEQGMADATKKVGSTVRYTCKQVSAMKQGTGRGDHCIKPSRGQKNVIRIAKQTLATHHAHLLMVTHDLRLMADALLQQQVIITEKLDQLT